MVWCGVVWWEVVVWCGVVWWEVVWWEAGGGMWCGDFLILVHLITLWSI